jgi:hypothetical protein
LGRCDTEREVALVLEAWCEQRGWDAGGAAAAASPPPLNAVQAVAALTRLASVARRAHEEEEVGEQQQSGGWLLADNRSKVRSAAAPTTTTTSAALVASLLSPALAVAAASGALDARGAANAAWALAKLGDLEEEDEEAEDEDEEDGAPRSSRTPLAPPPELLATLQAKLASPSSSLAEPRHHSMALWAVARWTRRRRRSGGSALPLPRGAFATWLPRAANALFPPAASFSSIHHPQAVANALHAAAELREACAEAGDEASADACRAFAQAFVAATSGSGDRNDPLPPFSPQQAACVARALAILLPAPPPAAWLACWLGATGPLLQQAGPQALSLLAWALPRLLRPEEEDEGGDDAAALLAAAVDGWLAALQRHSAPLLAAFDDQAVAVTCSALAKVGEWRRRQSGEEGGGSSTRLWLAALERATLPRLARLPPSCLAPTMAGAVKLARLSGSSSAPALSARWLAAAAAASAPLMPAASDEELRAVLTAVALGRGLLLVSGDQLVAADGAATSLPGAAWRALCHRELAARVPRMGAPREVLSVAGALLALDASPPLAGGAAAGDGSAAASARRAIAARLEAWLLDDRASHAPRDVALAAWVVARFERKRQRDEQQREEQQQPPSAAASPIAAPTFWAAALRRCSSRSSLDPDDASRLLWAVAVAAAPRPDEALLLPVVEAAGDGLAQAWRQQQAPRFSSSSSSSPLDAAADVLDALARLGFYPGGAWLRAFFAASCAPGALEAAAASSRRRRGHGRALARVARALSALGAVESAPAEWCVGWARAWRAESVAVEEEVSEASSATVQRVLERAASAVATEENGGA